MRKYIKNIRQQYDNNSLIFKEAKRMFHYRPSTSATRVFGPTKVTKNAKDKENQFKDDYSSVKDMKLQNNEINESSWIAKLVNGIQQNSLEDGKITSKQMMAKLLNEEKTPLMEKDQNKKLNTENIVIMDEQNQRLSHPQVAKHRPYTVTQVPTKKNSYNYSKKSETFADRMSKTKNKNDSFCQNNKNQQPKIKSIVAVHPKSKSLNRNISQTNFIKSQSNASKQMGLKKKSMHNIYVQKGFQQSKTKSSFIDDQFKLSSLKSVDRLGQPADKRQYKGSKVEEIKFNESLNQMESIKCITQKKDKHHPAPQQKSDFLLDDYFAEPLFQQKTTNPSQPVTTLQQKTQKKHGFGSIRRNNVGTSNHKQQKSNQNFKHQSTEVIVSPKFSSNIKPINEIITEKVRANQDYVSSRQEKMLVDKYLRSDYSFKSNQGQRFETQKSTVNNHLYKRDFTKKYNYQIISKKQQVILHPNEQYAHSKQQTKHRFQSHNALDINKKQTIFPPESYKSQKSLHRQIKSSPMTNDKYNPVVSTLTYNSNSDNFSTLSTQKTSIRPPFAFQKQSQKQKYVSKIDSVITKEVYLEQSSDSIMLQASNQKGYSQFSNIKIETGFKRKNNRQTMPSKYSYIAHNTSERSDFNNADSRYNTHGKVVQSCWVQGSDKLIDRLNSKLSIYIQQHQLKGQEENALREWTQGEPTHRALHLNFNQLKKHRQGLKR